MEERSDHCAAPGVSVVEACVQVRQQLIAGGQGGSRGFYHFSAKVARILRKKEPLDIEQLFFKISVRLVLSLSASYKIEQ